MSHTIRNSLVVLMGSLALLGSFADTLAQPGNPLSAEESDPGKLGWMTGFPPPAEKLIMQPESDFFSFPKLRWTVCHIRELMPTKQVSRGIGAPVPLEYAIDDDLDDVRFMPLWGADPMTWKKSLSENYTDGILIIHEGKVVYERYFGCLNEMGKHAAMSMTKSITGLLGEILVAEGALAEGAHVHGVIPGFLNTVEHGHANLPRLEVVADMRERKRRMIEDSDAVISLPGGTGTLEELLEVITLKRLGQFLGPIVLLNTNGYYDRFAAFLENAVAERFMSPRHSEMWSLVDEPEQVPQALLEAPAWSEDAREFAAVRS